ncbi:MAG: F0F1 ATP synthase subunit A [Oscillospiraceae bacterium]
MGESVHGGGPLFHLFGLEVNSVTVTTWGIMVFLTIVFFILGRNLKQNPGGRKQVAVELAVDSIIGFLGGVVGSREKAQRFFPILGTLFVVILVSNYSGLIPGMGHVPGMQAPTSVWSYSLGISAIVFVLTFIVGFRHHRLGYFKHYIKPVAIMIPLVLMEEIVRPFSLSLRLYGNVFAEETVVANIANLCPIGLPVPFMFMGIFFGFMQALVFTLLTATYLVGAFDGD